MTAWDDLPDLGAQPGRAFADREWRMSGTAYGPPSAPSRSAAPAVAPPAPVPGDVPPYPGAPVAQPSPFPSVPPYSGAATGPAAGASAFVDPGPAPLSRAAARAERARTGGSASLAVQPLPSRRLVLTSLAGAVAAGSVIGLVLGVFAPAAPDGTKVSAATRATTGSAPTTSPTRASSSPQTASATPKASLTVETTTADAQGAPGGFIENPQDDRSLRLGVIQSADRNGRGLSVWLSPAKLKDGQIRQTSGQPTPYLLRDDATIFLADFGGQDPHQVSIDQATGILGLRLGLGQRPVVWVKRAFGPVGPVIYLAEQKS